jgi:D-tagatose-1,6-bisphosphate aldolase subunit GatZ/KbaZ
VPIPGGAVEEEESLEVTSAAEFLETASAFRLAFRHDGLESAWERVVAFVVQPGVEFSDTSVHAYDRIAAKKLVQALDGQDGRVFEGHSTDYQTRECLRSMVEDGIAVLKVGPALTFALREGLFALNRIEEELLPLHPELEPSRFAESLDEAMVRDDSHWRKHHRGSEAQKAFARRFGLSDRSRYYLPVQTVQTSLARLLSNLEATGVPPTLISQYLPTAYRRVRDGEIGVHPRELVVARVLDCLADYKAATESMVPSGRAE